MNTNPTAKRILCFGDSNTWGQIPGNEEKRYPVDLRWTGRLQMLLGNDYEIIEEGRNGRTTVLDEPNRVEIGRNGKTYFLPCIASHNPLDLVIIMLGTNDLKHRFNRSPQQIAEGIQELIQIAKENAWDLQKKTSSNSRYLSSLYR